MNIDDIMISFQYCAAKNGIGLDFSTDEYGNYTSSKTKRAFFWYCKGFIQGEKG